MVTVAVKRLALSASPGRSSEARMRVEDSLRLCANDDDRLFLFRRFDFGTLPSAARPALWHRRAEDRMRSLTRSAVHASDANAAMSEAVWFRSLAEAQSLLLMLLASGYPPSAWFWRLALPDWGGASLETWLPRILPTVRLDRPAEIMLARAVVATLARGHAAALISALAGLPDPHAAMARRARSTEESRTPAIRYAIAGRHPALRLMARHDRKTRAALARQFGALSMPATARHWLAHFAILAVAPEMATESEMFQQIEQQVCAPAFWTLLEEHQGLVRLDDRTGEASLPPDLPPRVEPGSSAQDRMADTGAQTGASRTTIARRPATAPPQRGDEAISPQHDASSPSYARLTYSDSAGLWLLIPTFRRLGLGEWIAQRDDQIFAGFGQALVRHVAARHGVASDDALLGPLPNDSEAPTHWLNAWRIGADRWLRRKAGVRLYELIGRRGSFSFDGVSLTLGFDHDLADVRLRRWALDVDPGWVEWLGLSIRYRYTDRGRHDLP